MSKSPIFWIMLFVPAFIMSLFSTEQGERLAYTIMALVCLAAAGILTKLEDLR